MENQLVNINVDIKVCYATYFTLEQKLIRNFQNHFRGKRYYDQFNLCVCWYREIRRTFQGYFINSSSLIGDGTYITIIPNIGTFEYTKILYQGKVYIRIMHITFARYRFGGITLLENKQYNTKNKMKRRIRLT